MHPGEIHIFYLSISYIVNSCTNLARKTLFPQALCTIQIDALPLLQHTYPASRKNSALRVSLFFYGHDDTRDFLVNLLVSPKNVFLLCSGPVFNVILVRLGASTRFLSQAQQRTRIHSPLVSILQNAMFSLNSFVFMKTSFLLLTLLCGALSAWAHDAEVDGIFYNLNNTNKTATVTYKGDSYDVYEDEYAGDVVIPKAVTYKGITYSVTSLGDCCFRGCRNLTSITIPNSVTSLGEYCFTRCSRLTSITIPNSVTSVEGSCFYGCSSIERIVVDAANPVYDSRENSNAIIHTSTNELVVGCKNSKIPNSVTSLGDDCFFECSSLTSITIPNSVTSLGGACFFGCSDLTSITIPNSVTSLGGWCFCDCI